jgi:hypothetical protein
VIAASVAAVAIVGGVALWFALRPPPPRQVEHISVEIVSPPPPPQPDNNTP